jgi:hypothetical protein
MSKKIWDNISIEKFLNSLGYRLVDNYISRNIPLIFTDRYGYYYKSLFDNVKHNEIPRLVGKSNPYSIQNIKIWCKLNNKPFKLLSQKYEGKNIKLQWKCLRCNCSEIFEAIWGSMLANNGCSFCSGKQVGLSNCLATKNPKLASERHPTKNGDLTPYDVTAVSGKRIWWQCNKNSEHEWIDYISNRNKISSCPFCSGKRPSKDYNLLVINPELCEDWDYNKNKKNPEEYCPNSSEKVYWKCKECGHEWKVSIYSRNGKSKNGCPECSKSKGEKRCKEVFISKNYIEICQDEYDELLSKYNNSYFIPQKAFNGLKGLGGGLLSYDFYLPKYNLLIEYQGEQHERYIKGFHKSKKDFEKQIEHDRRKKEYAKQNGYNFLEIWYWDFDNIESILVEYLSSLNDVIYSVKE